MRKHRRILNFAFIRARLLRDVRYNPAQTVMHSCLPDTQNVSGLYHSAECAGADFQHKAEHLPDELHIGPYNALDDLHIHRRIRRSCAVSMDGFVRYARRIHACGIYESIESATFSHSSAPECRKM